MEIYGNILYLFQNLCQVLGDLFHEHSLALLKTPNWTNSAHNVKNTRPWAIGRAASCQPENLGNRVTATAEQLEFAASYRSALIKPLGQPKLL